MKISTKKGIVDKDDSMYGVLLPYRKFSTYIEVLEAVDGEEIVLVITNNPKHFVQIREIYEGYSVLRRIEMDAIKKFIKFLEPIHLLYQYGNTLGVKLPESKCLVKDFLNKKGNGYYALETSKVYKEKIIKVVNKLLKITPQKKYSILDNYFLKEEDDKNE